MFNHKFITCVYYATPLPNLPSFLFIYFFHPMLTTRVMIITVCHIIPIAFTSKDLGKVLIATSPPSCKQWIQDWTKQLLEAADKLRVLAEASEITTPLIVDDWRIMLNIAGFLYF